MNQKILPCLIGLMITSCNYNQQKMSFKNKGNGMANTLKYNAVYDFEISNFYNINDIVLIDNIDIVTGKNKKSVFRIMGKSGDKIQFINGDPYLNEKIFKLPVSSKRLYTCKYDGNEETKRILSSYGEIYVTGDTILLGLTEAEYYEIMTNYKIQLNKQFFQKQNGDIGIKFNKTWNRDFFGPIILPRKLVMVDSSNCVLPDTYKYAQLKSDSLYFLVGDNLQDCIDSRYIGLVPKSLILGKLKSKTN